MLNNLANKYDYLKDKSVYGCAPAKISFAIVIDRNGNFQNIEDLRECKGKKKLPRQIIMPKGPKRSNNITSLPLYDKSEYILGISAKENPSSKDIARIKECHNSFIRYVENTFLENDKDTKPILKFLKNGNFDKIISENILQEMVNDTGFITFKFDKEDHFIPQKSNVLETIIKNKGPNKNISTCAICGKKREIARLHESIKGVVGAQSSGSNIVSFNTDASTHFHKIQGANYPVCELCMFKYTTVLNKLLSKNSKNKTTFGELSIVFWSDESDYFENEFYTLFMKKRDENDLECTEIDDLLDSFKKHNEKDDKHFNVLGILPNASRLSIVFYYRDTIKNSKQKIRQYFENIRMKPSKFDYKYPSLFSLIYSTVKKNERKASDSETPSISNHAKIMFQIILNGSPFPIGLATKILELCKIDNKVSSKRVCLLKLYFNQTENVIV